MTDSKTAAQATDPPIKKKKPWCVRFLLWFCMLTILLLGSLGYVLLNPQSIITLLEWGLKSQGGNTTIHTLQAELHWPNYHFNGQISADGEGFSVEKTAVNFSLNIENAWQEKTFFNQIHVNITHGAFDIETFKSHFSTHQKPENQTLSSHRALDALLIPKDWMLACTDCQINSAQYHYDGSFSAVGQGVDRVHFTAKDKQLNEVQLNYEAATETLTFDSQRFDLATLTDYAVRLDNVSGTITLNNLWGSHVQSNLHYQGLESQISIAGQGENHLALEVRTGGETVVLDAVRKGNQIQITSEPIDLALVDHLKPVVLPILSLSRNKFSPKIFNLLNKLSLSGKIAANVLLDSDDQWENLHLVSASLKLNNVAVSDSKHGITGLSGRLALSDEVVDYQLSLKNTQLALPEAYTRPLAPITGNITGDYQLKQQYIHVQSLKLSNKDFDDLSLSGAFSFKEALWIDLEAEIKNLTFNRLKAYLPEQFPPMTKSWLSKALVSGKKNYTRVKVKGDLKRFLKDEHFVLKINTTAQDGVFHYFRDNPDINIKNVDFSIDHRRLTAVIKQADLFTVVNQKTLRVPISGNVLIKDMLEAEVEVEAKTTPQPLSKLTTLAERSIAQKSLKKMKTIVNADGQFTLALNLWLDVHSETGDERFDLQLMGRKATATLIDYPTLTVKQANATVSVNDDGLQHLTLSGKALEQPITIDLKARNLNKKSETVAGYDVALTAERANVLQLLQHLKLLKKSQVQVLKNTDLIKGESGYQVALRLTADGNLIDAEVSSPLRGTQLSIFGLLTKKASSSLPLRLIYSQPERHLQLILGKAQLVTRLDQQGNMLGLVLDNQQKNLKLEKDVAKLYWHAKYFDYQGFQNFQTAWAKTSTSSQKGGLNYQFDINVDYFKLNEHVTEPLKLQGKLEDLLIASPLLAGQIHYENHHLQAHISRAEVGELYRLAAKVNVNSEGREVTTLGFAHDIPTLDITVDQLIYQGTNIGNAMIHSSIELGNYSIDQMLINGRQYYIDVSGHESQEKQGTVTKIQADFKGEKLREIVALLGLHEVLDAKFLDVSLNLSWPGKAHTMNLRQSYGNASLNAQNVKMVKLSSGVGSVFGLMDIAGILRRISLDFKNLNSSKISFDTVEGKWNIGGGRAMAREVYATGSVIDLRLTGAADLHRRVFDSMDLTVIPKASNIIPVIGAVAGGVAGAAVGVMVQQAIGNGINQAVGLPYVVSGAWDAPVVSYGKR